MFYYFFIIQTHLSHHSWNKKFFYVIGYENVSKIVHYAIDNNKDLEETCKILGYSKEFDKIIKPILQ